MWAPEQYERFRRERRQPFDDLLTLVEKRPGMRVVDLGCGTGELTRELHETLGAVQTIGVDSSENMLARARSFSADALQFRSGTIESFAADEPVDLLFSNAAFHWVPQHEQLIARLTQSLSDGGQLAVQMPANDTHASHRIAAQVAEEFGIAPRPDFMLSPDGYAELLYRLGYKRQHVRLQAYGHELPSSADVVEWVRGALLTHYEALLTPARYAEFLRVYRARVAAELGDVRPYFYTYKRVLIWGARA